MNFALVKYSGLDTWVISLHRTEKTAENAMRRLGGEPHSMFMRGMGIVDISDRSGNEVIEIFGRKTIRQITI